MRLTRSISWPAALGCDRPAAACSSPRRLEVHVSSCRHAEGDALQTVPVLSLFSGVLGLELGLAEPRAQGDE